MSAQYQFTFSDDFLVTAHRKNNQLSWLYRVRLVVNAALVLLFLCSALFVVVQTSQIVMLVPFAMLAAITCLFSLLSTSRIRQQFRSSPYFFDEVQISLSDQGFVATGRNSEMRLGWASFTKARRFPDGLLLYQGPAVFNWLPDVAATTPESAGEALALVTKHIADFREVR